MAKRFTDTDKWKKTLLKSMPSEYKLLWLYICDDCDHAGIWHVDIQIASLRIGEDVNVENAIKIFGDKIKVFDNGEKWFIPGFIQFQYGELNPKNRVHESILKILNKYKLLENKPLTSPLQGDKDMDKEQDMDKDKGGTGENFLIPEMFAEFKKVITTYPGSIERDYKPLLSIANFICEQGKATGPPHLNKDSVMQAWMAICLTIKDDKFYRNKSLSTISNHIQEITQNAVHGKSDIKIDRERAMHDYIHRER